MQAMHARVPIVRRHHRRKQLLRPPELPRGRAGDADVLLPLNAASLLLLVPVTVGVGRVSHPLLLTSTPSVRTLMLFEAPSQADSERVLLFRELVDEVPGIAPEREVRPGVVFLKRARPSGQTLAVAVLLVELVLAAAGPAAAGGGVEGVQGDVGRLAGGAGEGERNDGGRPGLEGSSPVTRRERKVKSRG